MLLIKKKNPNYEIEMLTTYKHTENTPIYIILCVSLAEGFIRYTQNGLENAHILLCHQICISFTWIEKTILKITLDIPCIKSLFFIFSVLELSLDLLLYSIFMCAHVTCNKQC